MMIGQGRTSVAGYSLVEKRKTKRRTNIKKQEYKNQNE
jgi:hypothetical protein